MSTPPSSPTTSPAIASTDPLSETSAPTARVRAPPEARGSATLWAFSRVTSTQTTAAPACVSFARIPSASPPPPPVTAATRPSRGPATRTTLPDPDSTGVRRRGEDTSSLPSPTGDDIRAVGRQQARHAFGIARRVPGTIGGGLPLRHHFVVSSQELLRGG